MAHAVLSQHMPVGYSHVLPVRHGCGQPMTGAQRLLSQTSNPCIMAGPGPGGVYLTTQMAGVVHNTACFTPSMPTCDPRHVMQPILSQRSLAPQVAHGGNHVSSASVVVSNHMGMQLCPNQAVTARQPAMVQRTGPTCCTSLPPACVQVQTLPAGAFAAVQSEARACPSPVRGILVKQRSLSQSAKKGVVFGMRYSANIDELEESVGKRVSVVEAEKQQRKAQEWEEERRMLMLQTEVIEEGDFSGEFSGGRPRSRSDNGVSEGGVNCASFEGGGGGRRRSTTLSGEEEMDTTKSMGRCRSGTASPQGTAQPQLEDDDDDSSGSEVWEVQDHR